MRVPDPAHKPPPFKWVIGIGVGLVAVAGVITYNNYRLHQEQLRHDAEMVAMPKPGAATRSAKISSGAGTGPASTRSVLETLRHQNDVDLVMTRGWDLINKRDPKSAALAAEIFREALRDVDPDNAQFYNGLGRALLIESQPQDALEAFKKGMAIDDTIADMQSGMGWAYWQLHQPYYAKQAWEAALAINPKSPDSWSALAWIYLAMGENAKAKEGFVILVAVNDKDNYAVQGLSMSRSAVPVDIKNVEKFFPLPPLEYFNSPPPPLPPATANTTQK